MTLEKTPAWLALAAHAKAATFDLQKLTQDRARDAALIHTLDGAVFDLSKNLVTQETLDLLVAFARQQDVKKNFAAQFAGEKMNASENHAVLHTALRTDDAPAEVHETLARMKKLSTSIRADKSIRDVVHIGIGGSDLGPRMVCAALPASGPRVHFVASVDPHDLQTALKDAKPESTLVIAVSKTFTSQETIINLHAARTWLKNDSRVIAVTANESAAKGEGIRAENILPMWDWVGGRFSVWSAVGLSVAISAGFDAFEQLLAGARRADSHVSITPLDKNIPVLMALLTIWYRNFLKYAAMAVVPYGDALALLPSYLQQLEMESNGKRIDRQGNLCTYETAPVTFGMVGPNAQHAFMQMIHQGTGIIPCDFIGVADAHPILMANMKAQAQALMRGRHTDAAHAACPGNRPSTTITLPRLDPASLGLLLAIEEHKTAALGYLWNINSFDQFGVELGKTLAKELLAR